ncbi:MAG: hypothetical protein ACRC6H_00520, partial [Culicoidibacterales bacterium]
PYIRSVAYLALVFSLFINILVLLAAIIKKMIAIRTFLSVLPFLFCVVSSHTAGNLFTWF